MQDGESLVTQEIELSGRLTFVLRLTLRANDEEVEPLKMIGSINCLESGARQQISEFDAVSDFIRRELDAHKKELH